MGRERSNALLENYDLTRKIFAVRTLETLNVLIEREASQPSPNLAAIAALAAATAQLLAAVF